MGVVQKIRNTPRKKKREEMKMKHLKMGCVAGRHEIKQATDGYLFEKIDDVHDYDR